MPSSGKVAGTLLAFLAIGLYFCQGAAPVAALGYESELIVKFRDRDSQRFKLVRAGSPAQARAMKKKLAADPDVEYVETNQIAKALFTPNDPYFMNGAQWNLRQVNAPAAWDIDPGAGDRVIVAVLDTGVAYEDYKDGRYNYRRVPDFDPATFVPGWDFVNNDSHPNDDHGHGTHVSGVIAQATNNGYGAAGLAYGARIMPVKVLDGYGTGSSYAIAKGIRWAAKRGAKVINLSLGFERPSRAIEDAIDYVRAEKGVTVVAAAGNSADLSENPGYRGGLMYPARYSSVISVGATRYGKRRAAYSQFGSALDLVAPGGEMYGGRDLNKDGYPDGVVQETIVDPSRHAFYWAEGTSVAAPHVAAAAAMIIAGGVKKPAAVYRALTSSAKDLGHEGRDSRYGYGLLNVAAALRWRPLH